MTIAASLQPDQNGLNWDHHVDVYQSVFEPLTNAFAAQALDMLPVTGDSRLLDVGAGAGGGAMLAARRGASVTAIDASPEMTARIRSRAALGRLPVEALAMDGMALAFADSAFDLAISVFGVVLFPDPVAGLREIRRVLKPGGCVAVVTWTQPHRYELATRLRAATAAVRGEPPANGPLPAQLRYIDSDVFRTLISDAGLVAEAPMVLEQSWTLPSARWLAERLDFAPGLAAMLAMLGDDREAVVAAFRHALEQDQGKDEIRLAAVAHLALGRKS